MVLNDPEIIQEFLTESTEHLADIEQQLLEIEAGGEVVDVDAVNTVFRGIHSIKGAAGFMGFESVQGLAHSLESVLNLMRESSLVPTSDIMDAMLGAADLLRQLIDDIDNSNNVDVSEYVKPLDAIVSGKSETVTEPPKDSVVTLWEDGTTATAPEVTAPDEKQADASAPEPPTPAGEQNNETKQQNEAPQNSSPDTTTSGVTDDKQTNNQAAEKQPMQQSPASPKSASKSPSESDGHPRPDISFAGGEIELASEIWIGYEVFSDDISSPHPRWLA